MKIVVGSDVVPTSNNIDYFKSGNITSIMDDNIKKIWSSADYRIFNLECVLGNSNLKKLVKNGPNLICDEDAINGNRTSEGATFFWISE